MKTTFRTYYCILFSTLLLTSVGSAQYADLIVDESSVQDAGIALRIKEAAEWYFYPEEFRSTISLFGYQLAVVQDTCTEHIGSNSEGSRTLAAMEMGRIAQVVDDSDTRTRVIVLENSDTSNRSDSQHSWQRRTFASLCKEIWTIDDNDSHIIATENPIPILQPTHRYLVDRFKLSKRTSQSPERSK